MAEPASFDEPLPFDDAVALLDAFRTGTATDHLIPDPPLVVVDLGGASNSSRDGIPLQPPATLPCVVAAINWTADPQVGPPPEGADLYITDRDDPPEPWVKAPGIDVLVSGVRNHPHASTTLAQVLRCHTGFAAHDLVTESLAYAALQGGREHQAWLETNRGRSRADDDGSPAVLITRSGDTLEVVLDRPARRNAFSARMRDDLLAALQLASSDPTITAVQLRGNGPSFCSGGDLAEFGTVEDPATAHDIRMTRSAGYHAHLVAEKLTAHLHGRCVGAGVELPAFAGHVVAAPGTTFRLPEVTMGLIPGAGGTASIPRRIGTSRAAWLALTGVEVDAETALRWGLVDSIEPA